MEFSLIYSQQILLIHAPSKASPSRFTEAWSLLESLTVSSKFSPSAMMPRQLEAAIVPDDAPRASDAGLNLVRAADKAAAVALERGEIRQPNPDLKPS